MAVSDWSGTLLPFIEELAALKERIGGVFRRAEPHRQIGLLLDGLIGGAERKNGWQLAKYAGDPAPWRMPALLGRTLRDGGAGVKPEAAGGHARKRTRSWGRTRHPSFDPAASMTIITTPCITTPCITTPCITSPCLRKRRRPG